MNRRRFVVSMCALAAAPRPGVAGIGRSGAAVPDLTKAVTGDGWQVSGRGVGILKDGDKVGIRFDEKPGAGLALWSAGIELADGTIELDIRGKNVDQRSFVGVAFHVLDERTYDAVYFRPFNFESDDPDRRGHGVQYISLPLDDWPTLRERHPGVYEHAVDPVPDPIGWFHAKIVVASPNVSVFVDGADRPSLVVQQLNGRRKGRVGLWVGNNSGGDFANLKLTT